MLSWSTWEMSQHSWWLCGSFTRIHARDSSQNAKKESQTSPFLRLELTQVCSLFFHPLGFVCCVLCVRKEMWNTTGRRWEKPLDDRMAMSSLGDWDSGGRPVVYCHNSHLNNLNIIASMRLISKENDSIRISKQWALPGAVGQTNHGWLLQEYQKVLR